MTSTSPIEPPPRPRLVAGALIFIAGFFAPLLVPFVATSGLDAAWKTALSGLLLVGIPEVGMVIAIAILGRPGFEYLKRRIFGLLRRSVPEGPVGPVRHRVGVVLFVLPLLLAFLGPYLGPFVPGYASWTRPLALAGDLTLLTSLFLLGGEFWEKLRSLFVRAAAA